MTRYTCPGCGRSLLLTMAGWISHRLAGHR
jgi:hypothetical protein